MWPIDRILSGATTPGQNEPGSDDNEVLLCIPQNTSISGASKSDNIIRRVISYAGHSLRGSYPSAEMQSVYSTAPAKLAGGPWNNLNKSEK